MNYKLIEPVIKKNDLKPIERILTNRGIALADVNHYLYTTDDDILPPTSIANVEAGAKMLMKHIAKGDKIFVQVDSDCDGYTSASLFINYFNRLFPGVIQNNISYRVHEGKQHGLILETIPAGVGLVVAPDSSSNNYEEHEALAKQGIDVLVIDHHNAEKVSEYACVINNQLCDYPTKSLSGVGMVYKFCQYFDSLMNTGIAEDFRDVVAIGMIADMMDVRDFETRRLIDSGLDNIQNPFFKAMVKAQDFCISKGGGLNSHTVGFYIAPAINAITRAGTEDEKLTVFEAMLEYKAYEKVPSTKRGAKPGQYETRVDQACRTCTNVRNRQNKFTDSSVNLVESLIQTKHLLDNKILVVKLEQSYAVDRNIAGLIANKMANKYQRPCLILNKYIEIEDGVEVVKWEGSARGYGIDNFQKLCQDSGFVYLAEGQ